MTPYRAGARSLLCPRCGEMLDDAFDGVQTCVRCAGVWLAKPMIAEAFGSPRGPAGNSAWWRTEIECPQCAAAGDAVALVPYLCGDVLIDRCADHGIWFDAGELGRLIDEPEHEELAALYRRLRPGAELSPELAARRSRVRADAARRRVEEERAIRADLARAAEERSREQAADAARHRAEEARAREADLARAEERRRAQVAEETRREAERSQLVARRAAAEDEVHALEQQLVALRSSVRGAEDRLQAARAALRALDRELAALA